MTQRLLLNTFFAMVATILSVGCATVEKGALLGSFIGSSIGLAISSQQELSKDQKITGVAAGALIGGTLGYFATQEKLKKEQLKKIDPLNLEQTPKLKLPRVRKIWVPDQIIGEEFVSGHWKYLIDQPAVWTKED